MIAIAQMAKGFDVSYGEDSPYTIQGINFAAAKKAGLTFVFVKASQAIHTDRAFALSWKNSKQAGFLRSAYHYLDYSRTGRDQANYFADLLAGDPGELIPTVDFEQRGENVTAAIAIGCLREFVAVMRERGYGRLIIYTSRSYWQEFGENNARWAQFPLWLADYTGDVGPLPSPWTEWTFWQFTPKGPGPDYGTESLEVPLDRFNGTFDLLQAFASQTIPPPLPLELAAQVALLTRVAREHGWEV